jgi:hypothetical protein
MHRCSFNYKTRLDRNYSFFRIPKPATAISHWHQMSDRIEFIDKQTIQDAHTFTWNFLQEMDIHKI